MRVQNEARAWRLLTRLISREKAMRISILKYRCFVSEYPLPLVSTRVRYRCPALHELDIYRSIICRLKSLFFRLCILVILMHDVSMKHRYRVTVRAFKQLLIEKRCIPGYDYFRDF